VSVEDDKRSGRPNTSKTTENVEKILELIHKGRRWTIHELADAGGFSYSYGVCLKILTENLLTCATLLHYDNAPAQTSLKTTEFVTDNNVVIIPHPPYSPDLAPCDFVLFPILKMYFFLFGGVGLNPH
jgi:hypothetical protein